MDLKIYLWKEKIDVNEFAKNVGVCRSYISSLQNNNQHPSFKLAKRIEQETKGKVKAKDMLRRSFEAKLKKMFPSNDE